MPGLLSAHWSMRFWQFVEYSQFVMDFAKLKHNSFMNSFTKLRFDPYISHSFCSSYCSSSIFSNDLSKISGSFKKSDHCICVHKIILYLLLNQTSKILRLKYRTLTSKYSARIRNYKMQCLIFMLSFRKFQIQNFQNFINWIILNRTPFQEAELKL